MATKGDRGKKKGKREPGRLSWPIRVFFISVSLSAVLSLVSNQLLGKASLAVSFIILLGFIALGVVFDIIGVAVTTADERPFHSMASHHAPGARESLRLIRRASQVSSFCNDVVGDICGIVSGATAAVIVSALGESFDMNTVLLSLCITALVSGLTIGGKALGKIFAMERSTSVVYWVGRVLHLFHRHA